MSEAPTDIKPAVTQRGTCEHIVYVGPTEYRQVHLDAPPARGEADDYCFRCEGKGQGQ